MGGQQLATYGSHLQPPFLSQSPLSLGTSRLRVSCIEFIAGSYVRLCGLDINFMCFALETPTGQLSVSPP